MANTDYRHLHALTNLFGALDMCLIAVHKPEEAIIEYPLDDEIRNILREINIEENDDEYKIFEYSEKIKDLWGVLIN